MKNWLVIACAIACFAFVSGCSSCRKTQEDEPVKVGSNTVTLKMGGPQKFVPKPNEPVIRTINIGPAKEEPKEEAAVSAAKPAETGDAEKKPDAVATKSKELPPEVEMNTQLTSRLKSKLEQAFADKGGKAPDIEIHTGTMSLDEFAKYYENKGYRIQRTSVPASAVIAPLLEEKPELAGKIKMETYNGVDIHQVIVEGANISAADKYIDPETYEIVNKTFVTMTKGK